jgi:hypothetical protein
MLYESLCVKLNNDEKIEEIRKNNYLTKSIKKYDIKTMYRLFIDAMIKITNELSKLLSILITKYRIWDEEKSSMSAIEENESMKIEKMSATLNIIMSNNWSIITRHKDLNHDVSQKWERYDTISFFKNMMTYLKHELSKLKKVFKQKQKMIIFRAEKYTIISEKSLLMYKEMMKRNRHA